MEHQENEVREQVENGSRKQDPGRLVVALDEPRPGEDSKSLGAATSWRTGEQGRTARREATFMVNWQSAMYLFVLGLICLLLAPLTNFWRLALVCGTAVPITLATLDRPSLLPERSDDRKVKERELLEALVERAEITPTTAAMRTSLTVDEASKMLNEFARKGHLKLRVDDGTMAYALQKHDCHERPGKISAPLAAGSESDRAKRQLGAPQQLDDPLSEWELEVLNLLASGRTNSEVARDLFLSVGTVKSHTNNIYRKLGARNRAGALARARGLDLL
jgi:DNA-binding CsgD family transcriptional regulator